ncbi:hypothetical protein FisN_8Lu242 [Fistulifera solaris]|uniref:Spore protein YkvP/CgeB glycosyl transferase-like domain-containing protein n=1 Tax=Fistulifera solaris TaxID=1519565 RepID=A0A1Z5JNN5_FISSO|nr:hypothetical protein FisN_8Lu242 [Fistulifera solaris]|eukprot:GAX15506.1 hypothetical protein FisN_8Lu242 [Fistulifera solaris]
MSARSEVFENNVSMNVIFVSFIMSRLRLTETKGRRWVFAGLLLIVLVVSFGLQLWHASRVTIRTNASTTSADRTIPLVENLATRLPSVDTAHLLPKDAQETSPAALIFDILSIGSLSRPDFLQAQRETMGRYARLFVGVTEEDDHSEPNCLLTREDAEQITTFCKVGRNSVRNLPLDQPYTALYIKRQNYGGNLSKKNNPGGWLCAQKRANDGLQIVLQKLRQSTLPDYLVMIDDDTFVDLPQLSHHLQTIYPDSSKPVVMAGCLIRFGETFTVPIGGSGVILSKGALIRLLKPILCTNTTSSNDDEFLQNACFRLQQNLFGERQYFRENMSLADLMHAYVSTNRFANHASWTKESSFCLHSDWIWGIFFNFYNVGDALDHPRHPQPYNRITSYRLSEDNFRDLPNAQTRPLLGQCRYVRSCPPEAHICHYVTADQIRQEGKRTFTEPKWVKLDAQTPIFVFLYPVLNHTLEQKQFLHDGIQESSQLTLTDDPSEASFWMVDVHQAGLNLQPLCNDFLQLVRSVNREKRAVIFVYWSDEPVDYFWDCYQATRLLDSTTVFRYKRSIVQGRQWNETLQFVENGSIIKFGNWRDHSGGPVRHIGYGVRSDLVQGLESILDHASVWGVERSVDLSHFWPLPEPNVTGNRMYELRFAVSQVIHDKLSPTQTVFVGVTEPTNETDPATAQPSYLRQLLQSKIVVVSQTDSWEDNYRLMEALVSGAMVMTDPMLTLPVELQEDVSVVYYRNLDELVTKAQHYLNHENERIAIAMAGYNVAMNHHRSWHLVERMVSEVRGVLTERKALNSLDAFVTASL